ncbi:unnamed protein product [Diabrotica balteata]|uniref:Uncharacterized protein n=1 Tax=Diabrotica balteata TaxID=107213 RepID=A0A9N9X5P7_DIABA|nr:unnamed protein product [Diabrotica balteata]
MSYSADISSSESSSENNEKTRTEKSKHKHEKMSNLKTNTSIIPIFPKQPSKSQKNVKGNKYEKFNKYEQQRLLESKRSRSSSNSRERVRKRPRSESEDEELAEIRKRRQRCEAEFAEISRKLELESTPLSRIKQDGLDNFIVNIKLIPIGKSKQFGDQLIRMRVKDFKLFLIMKDINCGKFVKIICTGYTMPA